MSNINNWDFEGEDTEPLEVTEESVEDTLEDALEETTKSEEVAQEFDITATIKEENDDKVAEENNVVGSKTTASKGKKKSALTPDSSGVISSGSVTSQPKKAKAKAKENKDRTAVFSTKNVTWSGVGKVYRGYNIVTQEQADKWVTRDHIRLATPEEIAQEFGK